ncbi:MAG TPA: hypothetical protein VEL07_17500 [Planctomycetota bacterium]|nr:hypothetical protein [Planctomycetota bacterium]
MTDLPFLWGAQYYRAPTPESDCWEGDLARTTRWGQARRRDPRALLAGARRARGDAGARRVVDAQADEPLSVRVDALVDPSRGTRPRFIAITNRSDAPRRLTMAGSGRFRGLFSGAELDLAGGAWTSPARCAELFVVP